MATQYTPILQLALPVTGELNGTWGDVVNDNITSMVEQAIAGLATINTWTTNSHTLTTADGTTDEARCAMLVAATGAGGTALTAAGEIICPARTKLYVLSNTSAYTVTLKTAAGSGVAVPAGDTTFLFCDGTNVNACVTTIVNGHITGNLTVDGNTTLGNTTSDTITATARIASDLNPSADNTYDLGTSGNSWRNLYIDGTATIASLVATTADINGGTVDDATIGATTASTGRFTQVNITGQGDLRLEDTTGGEYVALQAPGTLAASYTLTMPADDGTNGQALITDGSGNLSWSSAASGDVYGPASATDNAVARFDGTTGKIIQNSAVTIGDDGATVIAANSTSDALRITQTGSGNALLVEDSNNPDATPFVVASDGRAFIGSTQSYNSSGGRYPMLQLNGYDYATGAFSSTRWSSDNQSFFIAVNKSRGATAGNHTVVQNGDALGAFEFAGSDGTNFISAAGIYSNVDGTPGTNDMPGRLVFSTTADGASSPTERMRIGSTGNVGIGLADNAISRLMVGGTYTSGSGLTEVVRVVGTSPSTTTSAYNSFVSYPSTQAASYTLTAFNHFRAVQNTIGAGSTVTNQYGFNAEGSITGATNNYGFYSNIASGTGRWNFYAAGSAPNYFAGIVSTSNYYNADDGAGNAGLFGTGFVELNRSASDAFIDFKTSAAEDFDCRIQQSNNGLGFQVGGNGSTFTAFNVQSSGNQQTYGTGEVFQAIYRNSAGATNNYVGNQTWWAKNASGSYVAQARFIVQSNTITAGAETSAVLIQATKGGTAASYIILDGDNDLVSLNTNGSTSRLIVSTAGSVNIGPNIAGAGETLRIDRNATGSTATRGVLLSQSISSDSTAQYAGVYSYPTTQAAAFTLSTLAHFLADQRAFGAGSTVTAQYGFSAASSLTGATNNYGFYSNIASGTGRFNFYAGGTADNYFAGSVGIGATANASAILDAQSTTKGVRFPNMTTTQKNAIASPAAGLVVFDTTLAKLCVYTGAAWQTITSA